LAGFAGVVVVFRRESIHEWSPADKLRLRLLLTNSILPLVFCVIRDPVADDQAAADRHLEMVQRVRPGGFLAVRHSDDEDVSSVGFAADTKRARYPTCFYLFATLGIATNLLQLYNAALLGAFWPFFSGIVVQLLTGIFQFARMILLRPE